jgi:hypothetical protein
MTTTVKVTEFVNEIKEQLKFNPDLAIEIYKFALGNTTVMIDPRKTDAKGVTFTLKWTPPLALKPQAPHFIPVLIHDYTGAMLTRFYELPAAGGEITERVNLPALPNDPHLKTRQYFVLADPFALPFEPNTPDNYATYQIAI